MQTIRQVSLPLEGYAHEWAEKQMAVKLPTGAKILEVGIDLGRPVIWIEFDKEEVEVREHYFCLFAGGQDIDPHYWYIASIRDTPYRWHLYQRAKEGLNS